MITVITRTGQPDIVDCPECRFHMRSRQGVLLALKHADIRHTSNYPLFKVVHDDDYKFDRSRHDRHYQRACPGSHRPGEG